MKLPRRTPDRGTLADCDNCLFGRYHRYQFGIRAQRNPRERISVFSVTRVTYVKPIYIIAMGVAIFAALAFAIGPDVVRYIKISAM